MTPEQARKSAVDSLLMQDSLAGIQIAPTLSMAKRKDTVDSLHNRGSFLRRMEWALVAIAALAIVDVAFEFIKRHG